MLFKRRTLSTKTTTHSFSYFHHRLQTLLPLAGLRLSQHRFMSSVSASVPTYENAISKLNSLQTNAAVLEQVRASGGKVNTLAISEMVEYARRLGYEPNDFDRLNAIHVTGTKGKGSTCAFCESILLHSSGKRRKIGLYTSPHLMAVRERIRLDGRPLSEDQFAKYFDEVWQKLEGHHSVDINWSANTVDRLQDDFPNLAVRPVYFRFLTLMAFHVFMREKVDVAILEVGIGGEYDSTNIIKTPSVTGVSALGLDHTSVLGNTIASIAWNKGGIYKKGVPALSVPQPEEGLRVLKERAAEKEAPFFLVEERSDLSNIKLGLAGNHQRSNAALAVALCEHWLKFHLPTGDGREKLNADIVAGLESARWPGRCQILPKRYRNARWYLDGAHTTESIQYCIEWYRSVSISARDASGKSERTRRTLIFNSTGNRDATGLLEAVKRQTKQLDDGLFFSRIIFCTNVTFAKGGYKTDLVSLNANAAEIEALKTQRQLAEAWIGSPIAPQTTKLVDGAGASMYMLPTIEHAIDLIDTSDKEAATQEVLVTGSLHLVGGVMTVLGLPVDEL